MFSRRLVLASISSSVLIVACATGTAATGGSGEDGDDTSVVDAGGKHFDSGGYGEGEGGSLADSGIGISKDGGTKTDGGGATPIDSGTTTPIDSGTTTTPTLCSGTNSSQEDPYYEVNDYDAWCDDLVYENGYDFPCATNSDCDGIFTVPACCFKGSKSTACYSDTSPKGTPQCVPQ